MKKIIRLGTRGSPLALVQATEVRAKLLAAHPGLGAECDIEIIPIRTSGDWKPEHQERSFLDMGGNKGLFTKEIEEALATHHIDMAVHSMKDLASHLPTELEIAVLLERLDARDAFIGNEAKTLDELPHGARVGTSSLRRQSQILARRPDLHIVPLRGNVDTRLRKLAEGIADATMLAVAGLKRLDATQRISSIMGMDVMLPAAAQGAIGIETRKDDEDLRKLLAPLNCADTFTCISAERALLKVLDGSCRTPIAAYAELTGKDQIKIDALVAKPDGTELLRMEATGAAKDAETIGADLGHKFKGRLPADFFTG